MTSTEFTVGLQGGRASSKVLKPPGGGSSDIFGLGSSNGSFNNTTNESHQPQDNSTKSRLFGETVQTPSRVQKDNCKNNIFSSEPHQERRAVKKPYVKRNPITGEEIVVYPEDEQVENGENKDQENNVEANGGAEKTEEPPVHPVQTSIRVRAPPGGKSSGIF